MRLRPADRPAWVRVANAAGRALLAAGVPLARLDEASLLERAMRGTGHTDFGGDAFREPLGIFLRALEEEAELTPVGRALARHEVSTWLANRLELTAARRRYPEISKEEIRAPIFVTGPGRSGTSILHELLAQDPANRVPRTWEVLHPCPPPETARYASDARVARADREVKLWERIAPAYGTMHENGGDVPQECIYLTAHEFRSDLLSGCYRVPSYAAWLARCDMAPAYAFHRRMLQLLQWRCPGERWVLKAPSHLWTLPALFAEYPDAHVVQTHRDPLVVMASMTSLIATLLWIRSDRVEVPPVWLASVRHMLAQSLRQRDAGAIPAERIHDVRYADLLSNPIGTILRLYADLGLVLSRAAEERMRAYLAAKPQGRRGAHRYRFEDTGLDPAAERERFRAYQERFDVPSELPVKSGTRPAVATWG